MLNIFVNGFIGRTQQLAVSFFILDRALRKYIRRWRWPRNVLASNEI